MTNWWRSTTARLTASYLLIIMVMSVGFSVVFYNAGVKEINRQLPPDSFYGDQYATPSYVFNNYFQKRISEGKHDLLIRLILLNILALLIGAGISYYLARRTLEPIERAIDAQARFSSDASHELRTPLTAIRTTNEVALRKQKLTLKEAKNVISSNLNEVMKLEKLSDGLLRLTRADGKQLIKKPVLLGEVANEAMNQLIEAAQAKDIKIEDSVPEIKVYGDGDSLTQATAILLENAIKYGAKGDTIYLEGEKTKDNSFGILSVRDTGPGMRASDLPHIFERFYRADHSRSRKSGEETTGYGLGLSIAKQIIDQHDGEIIVTSTQGVGSVFSIKLPLLDEHLS